MPNENQNTKANKIEKTPYQEGYDKALKQFGEAQAKDEILKMLIGLKSDLKTGMAPTGQTYGPISGFLTGNKSGEPIREPMTPSEKSTLLKNILDIEKSMTAQPEQQVKEEKAKEILNTESFAPVTRREAELEATKDVAKQAGKVAEEGSRDYPRVAAGLDTTFDSHIKFSKEQFDKWGVKPGAMLGLIDKVTPDQWNQYKQGFVGSGREAAAQVGRFLIPGVRGLSVFEVFAKSTAQVGDTIEGGAFNVANSMGNALATALANNIVVQDTQGNPTPIQNVTIDKRTGLPLSKLPMESKIRAINELKREHVSLTERMYLSQAYVRAPELLQHKTVVELTDNAPRFQSWEAVDIAVDNGNIPSGIIVKVNGEIGQAK